MKLRTSDSLKEIFIHYYLLFIYFLLNRNTSCYIPSHPAVVIFRRSDVAKLINGSFSGSFDKLNRILVYVNNGGESGNRRNA